jgi:hypothetical protein
MLPRYTSEVSMEQAAEVAAHSIGIRKELGLGDLVLTQILYVVGSAWVGTAAKLGNAHTAFWLLAIVFFYIPLTAVIIYLNRIMPWRAACTSGPNSASMSSPASWSAGIFGCISFC